MLEASYICPSCGEEIVVPIDVTQGNHQRYVEDCPVCCCPNVLDVSLERDDLEHGDDDVADSAFVQATAE